MQCFKLKKQYKCRDVTLAKKKKKQFDKTSRYKGGGEGTGAPLTTKTKIKKTETNQKPEHD